MRKLIMAGFGALALATAAPHMAAAQTAAPAVAAPADDAASPEKLALAKRYFAAMHYNQMVAGIVHQMIPAMMQQIRKAHPDMTDAQMQAVTDATSESMDVYMPKIADAMVPAIAETFTTEELTKLDEFYESPVGQSILAKMPVVMQKMAPTMMQIMPEMQADVVKRMCAKIDCKANAAAGK